MTIRCTPSNSIGIDKIFSRSIAGTRSIESEPLRLTPLQQQHDAGGARRARTSLKALTGQCIRQEGCRRFPGDVQAEWSRPHRLPLWVPRGLSRWAEVAPCRATLRRESRLSGSRGFDPSASPAWWKHQ